MATIIFLLILGLIIGIVVALATGRLGGPPSKKSPRPNTRKRDYRPLILPVGIAVAICLVGWLGLSLLFSPDETGENTAGNSISHDLKEENVSQPDEKAVQPGSGVGKQALLVADSPIAKAAVKMAPVASRLELVGSVFAGRKNANGAAAKEPAAPAQTQAQVQENAALAKPETALAKPETAQTKPPQSEKPQAAKPETAQPQASAEEAGSNAAPAGGVTFAVHMASFAEKDNAERNVARLKAAGIPAFISKIELTSGVWYRLMAGRFQTRQEAETYGRDIEKKGLLTGMGKFVVRPLTAADPVE